MTHPKTAARTVKRSCGRDLVLDGAMAVTLGPSGIVADSEIVIRGDTIAAIRPRGRRLRAGSRVVSARDRVALPGLFNAHLHSEFLLLKGLVEDRRLREWEESDAFNRAWAWVRDPANVRHVERAYRASYLQCVLGGTTFVAEFNCADDATPTSVQAMLACGIRGTPTLDLGRRERFPEIERAGCLYAMDDEEGLTEDELLRARELQARNPAARLTMHAAETHERMVLIRARLGRTTVELLGAHQLLGPRLLLSHAIHVTAEEIQLLARTGTAVVSSPVAEMKLADGVGPVAEMLALGITVALGTDAAVCNNGSDLFAEMKTAALLQKVTRGAHCISAEQALRMGTEHGARAFGLAERLGTLAPGKQADLVLMDARSSRMLPLIHHASHSNVMANLVYCATASDVVDVLVAGEHVVEARRHARLDERRVLAELQDSALRLHAATHGATRRVLARPRARTGTGRPRR